MYLVPHLVLYSFFFNDTASTELYTLSLHDALPISGVRPGLERADDLGQRGERALGGDQVRQAEARSAGQQVVTDLGRAADEGRRHLPHGLRVDAAPAALPDQLLGAGTPGVRDDERPEGIDLQLGEPVAGRLAKHGELGVPRRRQPVGGVVVLVLRALDRRGQ